jgi:hypothetical protein
MTPTPLAHPTSRGEAPTPRLLAEPREPDLSTITETDRGIAIWQRPVDARVQDQAAALAARGHLAVRLSLTPEGLAQDAIAALTSQCGALSAMRALLEDIQRLAGHFAAIATTLDGPRSVTLRLETLRDDGCRRFHVDRVRLRLLCTYLGPGTEWLTDAQVDREALTGHRPNEAILRWGVPQRLEPFWVAMLKGGLRRRRRRSGIRSRDQRWPGPAPRRTLNQISHR